MRRTLVLASLLAAVAACDDSDPSIVDAASIDAAPSDCGCTPDTPLATVTVSVFDTVAPVAAVPVYFLDGAGALIATVDTDASGLARAEMPTGGSVTALLPTGGSRPELATALGVQPGDTIGIRAPGGGTDMTIDLSFPANGSNGHYVVRSACGEADILIKGGSTVDTQLQLWSCGPRTDFVISADNGDGGPVSTFIAGDVAVANGATLTLTGTYVADVDVDTTFENLPVFQGSMQIERAILTTPFVVGRNGSTTDVINGTGATTLSVPVFTAPSRGAVVASGRLYGNVSVAEVYETAGGDYTLDTTGVFLPTFTTSADFDTATRTLSWGESATGAAPDLTLAQIEISRPSQKASWNWTVLAPHGGTSVQLPLLPGDGAEWNAVESDFSFVIDHLTGKINGGYRAAITVGLADAAPETLAHGFGRLVLERRQIPSAR